MKILFEHIWEMPDGKKIILCGWFPEDKGYILNYCQTNCRERNLKSIVFNKVIEGKDRTRDEFFLKYVNPEHFTECSGSCPL